MKRYISTGILLVGLMSVAVVSCETEEDTFREFVVDGENVTVGAVQDVAVSLGVGKIQMDVAINADPNLRRLIVKDGNNELTTLDINRRKNGADTIRYTLELPEKLYNFRLITTDEQGFQSIPYEFVATIYADKYKQSLISRKVTGMTFEPDAGRVTVSISNAINRMKESTLTYIDRNDTEQTMTIMNDISSLEINDFKPGGTSPGIQSTYFPPLQSGEKAFEYFLSPEINVDQDLEFPVCPAAADVIFSTENIDFGQLNNGATSAVQSFTDRSDDCVIGAVTVTSAAPFGISLDMAGPFDTYTLELDDISSARTIYSQFSANAGRNEVTNGSITVTASNVTTSPSVAVSGEEIGNTGKTGLHILDFQDDGPFATVDLSGDQAPRLDWGGPYHEALFDGDINTIAHGQDAGNPGTFTVDLAQDFDIVKVGWRVRGDKCCGGNRAMKRYQVWGLPDGMDPAMAIPATSLTPSTEDEWATEMSQKGWKILVDANLTDNPNFNGDHVVHDNIPPFSNVRYVRVAVFESFTNNTFDFSELELTADFGN